MRIDDGRFFHYSVSQATRDTNMQIREFIDSLERLASEHGEGIQVKKAVSCYAGQELIEPCAGVMFKDGRWATNDESASERANGGTAVRVVTIT